ncbi:alpha-fucosidase [Metarhizium robertsii ARSEF 23]|nr:alpha-fucosidase [Metarhizium robertsii ARSEF 23]KHO10667.1 alpha-fucosidase [Metarhizium robertsii ARSEF 23]
MTTAPNKCRRNTSDAFVSASSSQEHDSQQRPAKAPKAPSRGQPEKDCGSTAVPWIIDFLGVDARFLAIFTKLAYPRLLEEMDSSYHFKGRPEDGVAMCLGITSALVYLHDTMRIRHGHISARTILWGGDRPVLVYSKVDAKENPGYDPPESISGLLHPRADSTTRNGE